MEGLYDCEMLAKTIKVLNKDSAKVSIYFQIEQQFTLFYYYLAIEIPLFNIHIEQVKLFEAL